MRPNLFSNTLKAFVLLCCLTTSLTLAAAETVNINRADAATMIENWKGIGEVKAKAIVAYRKKNGPFKSVDELANVKGIGEGLLKNNRKLMSTSRGAVKPTGKAKASAGQSSKKSTTSKTDKKKSTAKKSSANQQASSNSSKKSNASSSASSTTSKTSKKKSKTTSKKSTSKKSKSDKKSSKKSSKKQKPNT